MTRKSIIEAIGLYVTVTGKRSQRQFEKVAPIIKDRYTCFLGGGAGFEKATVIYLRD